MYTIVEAGQVLLGDGHRDSFQCDILQAIASVFECKNYELCWKLCSTSQASIVCGRTSGPEQDRPGLRCD